MKYLAALTLLLGLIGASALAAPAKKVVKKARKPAQTVSYNCAVTYTSPKRKMVSNVVLESEVRFPGLEVHEEVTLTNKGTSRTLAVNSYYDTPNEPYIIDSLTCDDYLNCQGGRTTYEKAGAKTKPFTIRPAGSSSQAVLVSDMVIEYNMAPGGFTFRVPSYESTNPSNGVVIKCAAK